MLEAFMSAPVLVKVLGTLGLILVVNLLRVPFVAAVLVGTLALAMWCGHPPADILAIGAHRLLTLESLLLAVAIYAVIWLSSQMEACGVMRDLVTTLQARYSRKAALAMLPAVIGFLPMPGGALFSAPLIDRCDAEGNIPPLLKTQINYWFRHIWEYWWPLYPGVLLMMQITGLQVWQLMLVGVPLTLTALGAGYFFYLRRLPAFECETGEQEVTAPLSSLLLPVIVIVIVYAAVALAYASVRRFSPHLPALDNFIPMIIGVVCAMVVLQRRRPLARAAWKKIMFSTKALQMMAIVLALHVYGGYITADLPGGIPLIQEMKRDLDLWGIPLIAVMMIIPFISGLTFGVAFGFVGASLPIVVSLLGPNPSLVQILSTTVLAYGCGYLGMMISPMHVCIVVTNEHFRTSLYRSLAGILKPAAAVFCGVIVVHLVVKWMLGG
ncbi:MAG: DUF401 family protein [Armatimonadota bacterium]